MSRFVSGGTSYEPTERDDAWLKAQEQVESTRREKAELGQQEGGKSLYETLQANKAAKQEQFEESIRLRNQFRSLDEDEIEFLDSVLESTRAKEAAVEKENAEELEAFRKQREEAERAAKSVASANDEDLVATSTSWSVSKKRKKGREAILGGAKLRKTSSSDNASSALQETSPAKLSVVESGTPAPATPQPGKPAGSTEDPRIQVTQALPDIGTSKKTANMASGAKSGLALGLGAYSSDED